MRVVTIQQAGTGIWVLGLVGAQTEHFRRVTLGDADLAGLEIIAPHYNYKGDGLSLIHI